MTRITRLSRQASDYQLRGSHESLTTNFLDDSPRQRGAESLTRNFLDDSPRQRGAESLTTNFLDDIQREKWSETTKKNGPRRKKKWTEACFQMVGNVQQKWPKAEKKIYESVLPDGRKRAAKMAIKNENYIWLVLRRRGPNLSAALNPRLVE